MDRSPRRTPDPDDVGFAAVVGQFVHVDCTIPRVLVHDSCPAHWMDGVDHHDVTRAKLIRVGNRFDHPGSKPKASARIRCIAQDPVDEFPRGPQPGWETLPVQWRGRPEQVQCHVVVVGQPLPNDDRDRVVIVIELVAQPQVQVVIGEEGSTGVAARGSVARRGTRRGPTELAGGLLSC